MRLDGDNDIHRLVPFLFYDKKMLVIVTIQ